MKEQERTEEPIPVDVVPKRNWSTVSRSASRSTYIASPVADRLTLWHLRQFVQAADAEGVPDDTRVQISSTTERGPNGVSVRVDEKINGWPATPTEESK